MLRNEILDAVNTQLSDPTMPQVKKTFQRLKKEGLSTSEAKDQIADCLWDEMMELIRSFEPFNIKRYAANLDKLPVALEERSEEDDDDETGFGDLRLENDFLQMKMGLEHGASSWVSPDLPPDIAHTFLQGVSQFENDFHHAPEISVYELLGKPNFAPADSLSDAEVKEQFQKLANLLTDNHVTVESAYDLNDREFYTFIVQEIFEEKVKNVRLPGYTHDFYYENFHPDHELDINYVCAGFLEFVLGGSEPDEFDLLPLLADEVTIDGLNNKEDTVLSLIGFHMNYRPFKLKKMKLQKISIANDTATAKYKVSYNRGREKGEAGHVSGIASFTLSFEQDCWLISGIELPGW